MAITDQNRFLVAVQLARSSGTKPDWDKAANILSGLAMGDILPALAAIDVPARESVRYGAVRTLVRAAGRRIDLAITAVSDKVLDNPDDDLPEDQIETVRRYLISI